MKAVERKGIWLINDLGLSKRKERAVESSSSDRACTLLVITPVANASSSMSKNINIASSQIVPVVLLPEASKLVIINITADLGGPTTNRLFSMTPKDSHSSKSNSHSNRRTKLPPLGRPLPIADCDAKDIPRLRRRFSEFSEKIQGTGSWINQLLPRLQHWIRANPIPTMCLNAVFLSAWYFDLLDKCPSPNFPSSIRWFYSYTDWKQKILEPRERERSATGEPS